MRCDKPTHVYVMICDRFVKVGITNDLEKRLQVIRGANPHPVDLFWATDAMGFHEASRLELGAFHVLARFRLQSEWFDVRPEAAVWAIQSVAGISPEGFIGKSIWKQRRASAQAYAATLDALAAELDDEGAP